MSKFNLQSIIGLAGVAKDENDIAQRVSHRFEIPMLFIAIWIVVEWYAESHGVIPHSYAYITDLVVWLFFVSETAILTYLTNDKLRYLRTNWINVFIILLGMSVLWGVSSYAGILRTLRLFLLAAIFINLSEAIRQVLSKNHLGITLVISFIIIMLSGILIAGIDPNIESIWDGLWWAWVTVTTVGYGDVVPVSAAGKLFGALLIFLGIGLFSLLTANFSAFFVSKDEEKEKEIEKQTLEKLVSIEKKLISLEDSIDKLRKNKRT